MKKLPTSQGLGIICFILLLSSIACKKPNEAPALTAEDSAIPSKVMIQTTDTTNGDKQYIIHYDSVGRVMEFNSCKDIGGNQTLSCRIRYTKGLTCIDTFSSGDTTQYAGYGVDEKGRYKVGTVYDMNGYLTEIHYGTTRFVFIWKDGNLVETNYITLHSLNNPDTLKAKMEYYLDLADRTRCLYMLRGSVRYLPTTQFLEPLYGKASKNLLKKVISDYEGEVDITYQLDDNGNPIKINYHIEDVEPSSFRPTDIAHTLSYEYR